MRTTLETLAALVLTAAAPLGAPTGSPQSPTHDHGRAWCGNVILPQVRAFHVDAALPAVRVTAVRAEVSIVDGTASTMLEVRVINSGDRDSEAELLLPVPDGAVVSGFDFDGTGAKPSAALLPREEARATYDSIVARLKD